MPNSALVAGVATDRKKTAMQYSTLARTSLFAQFRPVNGECDAETDTVVVYRAVPRAVSRRASERAVRCRWCTRGRFQLSRGMHGAAYLYQRTAVRDGTERLELGRQCRTARPLIDVWVQSYVVWREPRAKPVA